MNMGNSSSSASASDASAASAAAPLSPQLQQQLDNAANYLPPLDETDVAFHDPCKDGTSTHAIILDAFERAIEAKALNSQGELVKMPRFHPLAQGKNLFDSIPAESLDRAKFLLADMSVKPETAEQLSGLCERFLNIDHHNPEEKNVRTAPCSIFDKTKCGAVLAFHRYNPDRPLPLLLKYIEDGDNFLWRQPYSRAVNEYMSSLRLDAQNFKALINAADANPGIIENIINLGLVLLENKEEQFVPIIEQAQFILYMSSTEAEKQNQKFNKVVMCHVPSFNFINDIAWCLMDQTPNAAFALITYPHRDGDKTAIALRSLSGRFDCAQVAKDMAKGGGHECSSGIQDFSFFLDKLPKSEDMTPQKLCLGRAEQCRLIPDAESALKEAVREYMAANYSRIAIIPENVV